MTDINPAKILVIISRIKMSTKYEHSALEVRFCHRRNTSLLARGEGAPLKSDYFADYKSLIGL